MKTESSNEIKIEIVIFHRVQFWPIWIRKIFISRIWGRTYTSKGVNSSHGVKDSFPKVVFYDGQKRSQTMKIGYFGKDFPNTRSFTRSRWNREKLNFHKVIAKNLPLSIKIDQVQISLPAVKMEKFALTKIENSFLQVFWIREELKWIWSRAANFLFLFNFETLQEKSCWNKGNGYTNWTQK